MIRSKVKILLITWMLITSLSCTIPSPPTSQPVQNSSTDLCTCSSSQFNDITPCPTISPQELERLLPAHRFFYILIDNSLSYDDRDMALTLLEEGMRQGIHPGDKIMVALVGKQSIEDRNHLIIPLTQVTPFATPTPVPVEEAHCQLRPTPTPITNPTTIQESDHDQIAQQIRECNKQIQEQEKEIIANANQCAQYQWYQLQFQEQLDKLNGMLSSIERLKTREPENSTELYGALFAASEVLSRQDARQYDAIILLIFTDGQAIDTPQSRHYDFSGVDVIMAVLPYTDDYSQIESEWQRWFQNHGAKSFDVLPYFLNEEIKNIFLP